MSNDPGQVQCQTLEANAGRSRPRPKILCQSWGQRVAYQNFTMCRSASINFNHRRYILYCYQFIKNTSYCQKNLSLNSERPDKIHVSGFPKHNPTVPRVHMVPLTALQNLPKGCGNTLGTWYKIPIIPIPTLPLKLNLTITLTVTLILLTLTLEATGQKLVFLRGVSAQHVHNDAMFPDTVGHFTLWVSLSLRTNFGLRPNNPKNEVTHCMSGARH